MNRLGFPLFVSTGLVLGIFLAPQPERVPVRVDAEQPTPIRVEAVVNRDDADVIAKVLEGFLVDALGTERAVLTRVCLTPSEEVRELPWRVRAELVRSRELLGWAARVPVEIEENHWMDAALSGRWQDVNGRVVVVSTLHREGETTGELLERYASAVEALGQVAQPLRARPQAEQAAVSEPGSWIAASGQDEAVSAAEAVLHSERYRVWTDRDGIEHRVELFDKLGEEVDESSLLGEMLARYPAP